MQKFTEFAQTTRNGIVTPMASPTVTVRTTAGVLATLYSDNAGTPKTNPFTGGLDGKVEFLAEDGRYNVTIAKSGHTTITLQDHLLDDPDDGTISVEAAQVVDSTATGRALITAASAAAARTAIDAVSAASLAGPGGATMVGGASLGVADYAALRALNTSPMPKRVNVTGYRVTKVPAPWAGVFVIDDSGSGADNGMDVIVCTNGDRYRREGSELQTNVLWDSSVIADGVTDCVTGLRNALAIAKAKTLSGNSGIYGSGIFAGSVPPMHFPAGVYYTSGYISADTVGALNYVTITGDNAIIVPAAGVTAFGGVAYGTNISGLIFRGGACAASLKTGNLDSTKINIYNCEFHNQTESCIKTDNDSPSTILNIFKSKFHNTVTTANILHLLSADLCNFEDNWVSSACAEAFIVGGPSNAAVLSIKGMVGVPLVGVSGQCWVKNYSKIKILGGSRFGGEDGGITLVKNYAGIDDADPTIVEVRGNEVFCVKPMRVIEFYRMPNIFIFEDNNGLNDSGGLYFDSGAQTDNYDYQPQTTIFQYDDNCTDTLPFKGDMFAGIRAAINRRVDDSSSTVFASEVVLQILASSASYGPTETAVEVSAIGSNDDFGNLGRYVSPSGAAGDDGYYIRTFTTALASGFTNDVVYTLEVPITVGGVKPISAIISACGQQKRFNVLPGKHILRLPFVYHAGYSSNAVSLSVYDFWASGSDFKFSKFRLLSGARAMQTENTVVHGTSAPASGNWLVGDRCIRVPATGQPKGWSYDGSFVSEGNL